MRDDAWLDRIRADNRRHLGLDGLRGAVIDAPSYRVLEGSPRAPSPQLRGGPGDAGFGSGALAGAGLACLLGAVAFNHSAKTRRNLGLAGAALLALAVAKGRQA